LKNCFLLKASFGGLRSITALVESRDDLGHDLVG
jgi:hypothetical protein